jgi:hypothetical protein
MVLRMKKTMTGRQRRGRSMTSGDRRRIASATARFDEEGEAPGRRVLVRAAYATKRTRRPRGSASPATKKGDDEELARPGMARRRNPRRRHAHEDGDG